MLYDIYAVECEHGVANFHFIWKVFCNSKQNCLFLSVLERKTLSLEILISNC